jgi:hypothetical protein
MGCYEIRVQGHLSDRRCGTFEPLEVRRLPDGTTSLLVMVRDQAALHALVARVRDLGVELIALRKAEGRPS